MKEGSASLDEFREPEPGEGPGHLGALPMDRNEWLPYLAEFEISEEKKTELLQTLWEIMTIFVYRGWGVDLLHKAIPALAEFSEQSESLTDSSASEDSAHEKTAITDFNSAAQKEAPQKGETGK